MNIFSKDDLRTLLDQPDGQALSIIMPMEPDWPQSQQNPVRFRNLLRAAEQQMTDFGYDPTTIDAVLQPGHRLLDRERFWRDHAHGLAFFATPENSCVFRLPLSLAEQVVVNRRWHVTPLLPLLSEDGQYIILVLSLNRTRLFWATRTHAREVELADIPHSLAEVLEYDEFEKQHQLHAGIGIHGSSGERSAIFHGQGDHSDQEKEEIQRYFQQVDHGVHALLHTARMPLVLAGVGYLHPIYAAVNTYPYLVEHGVHGNPDDLSVDDLREQAWELVEPVFQNKRRAAAEQYRATIGTGLASADLREILAAAFAGRCDTLFKIADETRWGSYDPNTATLELHADQGPDDEDLLEAAAIQTLLHNGNVYVVAAADMPTDAPIAAHFRY